MFTKDRLLLLLKEKRGIWVSGELLSNKLAVSRSAIWKHVGKLRDEGYIIESFPRKGYLFKKASDLLLANEIREGLDTRVFGQGDIIYVEELDSTNKKAKALASNGAPEGTLVISEMQTNGRGRIGRSWFSSPRDGIYASFVLRPSISPREAPGITFLTAVSVAEALLSLVQLDVRIKWPNDILVNGRKLAGILTEMSAEIDKVDYVIVGLGMNINTSFDTFPREIRETATSIFILTGVKFPRIEVVRAYLHWYEKYYDMVKKEGFRPVFQRWKELSDTIGQRVVIDVPGKKQVGKVVDIDNDGALILRDDQGVRHRFFSGDVTHLRPQV